MSVDYKPIMNMNVFYDQEKKVKGINEACHTSVSMKGEGQGVERHAMGVGEDARLRYQKRRAMLLRRAQMKIWGVNHP